MYFVQSIHDFFAEFQHARVTGRRRAARETDQTESKYQRNESRLRVHVRLSQTQKFCDDDDEILSINACTRERERESAVPMTSPAHSVHAQMFVVEWTDVARQHPVRIPED